MGYILAGIVCFFLGMKYQELRDLMLARRIGKLIKQREKISDDHTDYERWIRQDERIGKVMNSTAKDEI